MQNWAEYITRISEPRKKGKGRRTVVWDEEDQDIFLRYIKNASEQTGRLRVGPRRQQKYYTSFSTIMRITGIPIHKSTENLEELRHAVGMIEKSDYSTDTRQDCIKALGSAYNFIKTGRRSLKYADGDVKEIVDYSPDKRDRKAPKDMISREEIRELLKFGGTMDKAIIFTLFESGARIGEFLGMRKRDVKMSAEGADLFVRQGKTGQRVITIVEAVPHLAVWLNEHPIRGKGSQDAGLWTSHSTGRVLTPEATAKRVRVVVARLNRHREDEGIPLFSKPHNPHNFRHSRASELGASPGMTESILNSYMGWEQGSKMSRVYLHLNPAKVKSAILATYGKAKPEEVKVQITERTCPRCKRVMPLADDYCSRCGANMDSGKTISNVAELRQRVAKLEKALIRKAGAKLRRG